jgi:ribulose-bisphosphate carboxylase small chain
MRLTQGTFSFLPDLSDEQVRAQVRYCLGRGWAISLEFTDDPHPRNAYWEMWGPPMFDCEHPDAVMEALRACRTAWPRHYVKLNAFDPTPGRETVALSFIVQRPPEEPGFRVDRQEAEGRTVRYRLHAYATDRPEGARYRG